MVILGNVNIMAKPCYKIPYFKDFEELHGPTVFQLLCLPIDKQKEELIKTYVYLLKKKRIALRKDIHHLPLHQKKFYKRLVVQLHTIENMRI